MSLQHPIEKAESLIEALPYLQAFRGKTFLIKMGGSAMEDPDLVAKVMRDAMMAKLAVRHPGYGWETNVGYGTEGHREGLSRFGVTRHHRRSFAPITHMLSL